MQMTRIKCMSEYESTELMKHFSNGAEMGNHCIIRTSLSSFIETSNVSRETQARKSFKKTILCQKTEFHPCDLSITFV